MEHKFFFFIFGVLILCSIVSVSAERVIMSVPIESKLSAKFLGTASEEGAIYGSDNLISIEKNETKIELLERRGYKLLGEDKEVHIFLQDAVSIINATATWNLSVGETKLNGSQVSVCVIDTGVNKSHPALLGKVVAEHCFCADCCPDGTSEDISATDDNGHGTHVAGIVAASGVINGTAKGANIVAVKAMDASGSGAYSDIKNAMGWCITNSEEYNISVISLSLGEGQYTSEAECISFDLINISGAISSAVSKNISVVIATGNIDIGYTNLTGGISSPACLPNAIRVTASDKSDALASYAFRHSAFNNTIVGIGTNINSTNFTGVYSVSSGTSMATPMVAGTIAIANQFLQLQGITKTPSEIASVLNLTGKKIYDSLSSQNYSRINIYQTILALDETNPVVNLTSPENNLLATSADQTFICNATDNLQLKNLTFYLWNTTTLVNQTNINLASNETSQSFEFSSLPISTYKWTCSASDISNNTFTATNYTLNLGNVTVQQTSPTNNTYTNLNETNFTCSSQTSSLFLLSNTTIYIFNSTGLIYNSSTTLSGTLNSTTVNYTLPSETNYTWNCITYNNESQSSQSSNFTVIYETVAPQLIITGLPTSETSNSVTKTFSFNVSDDNLANCSLILNDRVNETKSISNQSETQNFSKTLTPSTYRWKINCSDLAGNTNVSDENSFTITAVATTTSSSGGGGGGGSVEGDSSNPISSTKLTIGYTKKISSGQTVYFKLSNTEKHSIKFENSFSNIANITVQSEPINLLMNVGSSKKLNLSSSEYYNLEITLNNVSKYSADITIKEINEKISTNINSSSADESTESSEVEKSPIKFNALYILLPVVIFFTIVIFVASAILLYLVNKKRKKLKLQNTLYPYEKTKKVKSKTKRER